MGPLELLVILAIVLLAVGTTRLPKLAKSMGESIKIFKSEVKSSSDETAEVKEENTEK